jgi:serine phosphatase RsbU (regulator of sigma subunit)
VLYSDGLVENRRRGLDAGLDELVSVAGQAGPGVAEDPARLLEYLVDRMLTGYEQDDDVTVLVLHVPRRDGWAHGEPGAAAGPQKPGGR